MYPYLRVLKTFTKKVPNLDSIWDSTHQEMHVWPGDIDIFMEVNNGRYLTLMDFGRFEYFRRLSWMDKQNKGKWRWRGAVAGTSIRYRKRLHLFQKFTLSTKLVALDERWWYLGQTVERLGDIHASALVRFAVIDKHGLVPTTKIEDILEQDLDRKMPDWVKHWDDSDQMRPWVSMSKTEEVET